MAMSKLQYELLVSLDGTKNDKIVLFSCAIYTYPMSWMGAIQV